MTRHPHVLAVVNGNLKINGHEWRRRRAAWQHTLQSTLSPFQGTYTQNSWQEDQGKHRVKMLHPNVHWYTCRGESHRQGARCVFHAPSGPSAEASPIPLTLTLLLWQMIAWLNCQCMKLSSVEYSHSLCECQPCHHHSIAMHSAPPICHAQVLEATPSFPSPGLHCLHLQLHHSLLGV